jgi:hypothetical protein
MLSHYASAPATHAHLGAGTCNGHLCAQGTSVSRLCFPAGVCVIAFVVECGVEKRGSRRRRCPCVRTLIRGEAKRGCCVRCGGPGRVHTLLRSGAASECSARQRCLILPFRLIVPLRPHMHSPAHPALRYPFPTYLSMPYRVPVPVPVPSMSTIAEDG